MPRGEKKSRERMRQEDADLANREDERFSREKKSREKMRQEYTDLANKEGVDFLTPERKQSFIDASIVIDRAKRRGKVTEKDREDINNIFKNKEYEEQMSYRADRKSGKHSKKQMERDAVIKYYATGPSPFYYSIDGMYDDYTSVDYYLEELDKI